MTNYVCKIAKRDEIVKKCDYEIKNHPKDNNWKVFKEQALDNYDKKRIINYIGLLDNEIICEATAVIDKSIVQNSDGLVDKETVYLSGFRTNKEYQEQGYFSKLFKYMINDLKTRNYKYATLGVEACEVKNMMIYFKYGFINFIKTALEEYPDGKIYTVNYYKKEIV